jgi:hypothetical protein
VRLSSTIVQRIDDVVVNRVTDLLLEVPDWASAVPWIVR